MHERKKRKPEFQVIPSIYNIKDPDCCFCWWLKLITNFYAYERCAWCLFQCYHYTVVNEMQNVFNIHMGHKWRNKWDSKCMYMYLHNVARVSNPLNVYVCFTIFFYFIALLVNTLLKVNLHQSLYWYERTYEYCERLFHRLFLLEHSVKSIVEIVFYSAPKYLSSNQYRVVMFRFTATILKMESVQPYVITVVAQITEIKKEKKINLLSHAIMA